MPERICATRARLESASGSRPITLAEPQSSMNLLSSVIAGALGRRRVGDTVLGGSVLPDGAIGVALSAPDHVFELAAWDRLLN